MKSMSLIRIVPVILVSLMASSVAYAQGNLVDFQNWTVVPSTPLPPGTVYSYGGFTLGPSNCGTFYAGNEVDWNGSGYSPRPNLADFTGSINTTPGQMYEISCTSQDAGMYAASLSIQFDGSTQAYTLPVDFANGGYTDVPVFVDLTFVATSDTTAMTLQPGVSDYPGSIQLSDFSVSAVPEPSTLAYLLASALGAARLHRRRNRC